MVESSLSVDTVGSYGRLRIMPFPLPTLGSLSKSSRKQLEEIDSKLSAANEEEIRSIKTWLNGNPHNVVISEERYSVLLHELSAIHRQLYAARVWPQRSLEELKIISENELPKLSKVIRAGMGLQTLIARIASPITAGQCSDIRTIPVETMSDRFGNVVVYPPASLVKQRLLELDEFLSMNANAPASFVAMVLLVAISNLHPLGDGNGRLSRIMFNWANASILETNFYLPIYELAVLSHGGFIVRVRLAERRNSWEPLVGYLLSATELLMSSEFGKSSTSLD